MAITAATRTRLIGLSVAMLGQAPGTDTAGNAEDGDGLWLLFDIDGGGDFSTEDDMVIFLAGDTTAFDPSNDISM